MVSNKIIVTGRNGQLGSELAVLASEYPQYEFLFFSRDEFPVQDTAFAQNLMVEHAPAFFVNCAAYTAVDKAESERELANEINGHAVGRLASLCKAHGAKFIHVSTDYVFNGQKQAPLKEDEPTDPVNAYGASKLLGEQLAMEHNPDTVVIRTSWVYSSFGKNFVKTMMRLMKEKESINVVGDQFGSPTYAADLAEAILQIIGHDKWLPGIYQYSNEGTISWHEFATEIARQLHSNCKVLSITTDQYPTPARRPHFAVMDKGRIAENYQVLIKNWKESLRVCLDEINAGAIS
jgi:dTDP-4-dehydrorhamnose reductase